MWLRTGRYLTFSEAVSVAQLAAVEAAGYEWYCALQGRVQQLTGQIGRTIGTAYVRQVSCWTTVILIQWNKMAVAAILFYWMRMKVVQQLTCLT